MTRIESPWPVEEEQPPRLLGRRAVARVVDALLAVALSCLICWPIAWGAVNDALAVGGLDSARELFLEQGLGAPSGSDLGPVLAELRPVVLATLLLQGLVVWAYEALATTLTGSTPGKALARLRVSIERDRYAVTVPGLVGGTDPRRGWWERPVRMGVRAAVVVGPPAVALASLAAGALGEPESAELAEISLALSIVTLALTVATQPGAHGAVSRTRVVDFSWQQARERFDQEAHRAGQTGRAEADRRLRTTRQQADRRMRTARGGADHRLRTVPGEADHRVAGLRERAEGRLARARATLETISRG